ncbi:HNH endonuclease [Streptomyces malaysiensis]|uniref:HNH endonuclease n=1 Tax=Streptomyces malaysiensis TaxID=92644 RepID=UPI003556E896
MPQDRPDIPAAMKRAVLVEAGHRCAIPTCRQVPVELAHITPWAKVREHSFDNLIALCPTCHTRYDDGAIDRLSMLQYKANLTVVNSRYTDLERQVLEEFAKPINRAVMIPRFMAWAVRNLLRDGLFEISPGRDEFSIEVARNEKAYYLAITRGGRDFVKRYVQAKSLDN